MAQQLRALATLVEHLGVAPSTRTAIHDSGDLTPSSGLHGHCTHMVHRQTYIQATYTYTQTHTKETLKMRKARPWVQGLSVGPADEGTH